MMEKLALGQTKLSPGPLLHAARGFASGLGAKPEPLRPTHHQHRRHSRNVPRRRISNGDTATVSGSLTAALCCNKHAAMEGPRSRTKTARLIVNPDARAYSALRVVAARDVPVSQVARRQLFDFISCEESSFDQPSLPLTRSSGIREPVL